MKRKQQKVVAGVVFTCLLLRVRADWVCLCRGVVKCARWCFYVQERAQVFVGHRRLQARLHLAAIKLRESGRTCARRLQGPVSRPAR